jgi:hypothetical protein
MKSINRGKLNHRQFAKALITGAAALGLVRSGLAPAPAQATVTSNPDQSDGTDFTVMGTLKAKAGMVVGDGQPSVVPAKAVVYNKTEGFASLVISGSEYGPIPGAGPVQSDNEGVGFLLWLNRDAGRQLLIGDSKKINNQRLGGPSPIFLRFWPQAALVDACTSDGSSQQLKLGTGSGAEVRGKVTITLTSPGRALDVGGDAWIGGPLSVNGQINVGSNVAIDSAGIARGAYYAP